MFCWSLLWLLTLTFFLSTRLAPYRGWFPVISSLCCSNFVYFYTFNSLKTLWVKGQHSTTGKDLVLGVVAGKGMYWKYTSDETEIFQNLTFSFIKSTGDLTPCLSLYTNKAYCTALMALPCHPLHMISTYNLFMLWSCILFVCGALFSMCIWYQGIDI